MTLLLPGPDLATTDPYPTATCDQTRLMILCSSVSWFARDPAGAFHCVPELAPDLQVILLDPTMARSDPAPVPTSTLPGPVH
jgi:hypothetical protein